MEQGEGEDDPLVTERVYCTQNISLMDAAQLTINLAQQQMNEALQQSRAEAPALQVSSELLPSSSHQLPDVSEVSASMEPQVSQGSSSEESIVVVDYNDFNLAAPVVISSGQTLYDSTPDLSDADTNSPIFHRRNTGNLESDTSTEDEVLREFQDPNQAMRER